jgi:hypothetical protein
MGTDKRRINSAVRVLLIALVAELEHAQVVVELEHARVVVELERAQVEAERVLARVVVELERAQVEAERVLAQVAVELELAQVEVVPEPGHRRAQLGVAPRTKSVTAPHRPGLPLLAAEDLAAVAETTRGQAAAEAVIAWAAAVTAVAVAGIAVAVE